ncbi:alanine/glycine:cation symporter family protein [Paenactinomyces guangxiensis]|uniref:Sodium:alanine symporter family protein n=1 Tax=Paenactinomyces guangxiensis TaxID=1490290 RepID=A0A7W1WNI3_9BACL|nr:sodium:alanine symporter family protein [Paenactinomyces guangxiensis]MBA4493033.1 sodium:alanine symporter family protein [Paenactinomyces guangxiensis]MBH8590118.1 sodium:alanine symporter family protein [Paenactinomyces guangxiensis]
MKTFSDLMTEISNIVWGPPLLVLLVGTGIYLTVRLSFLQFSQLPYALKLAFSRHQDKKSQGDISHFQSLMTALAATIGTGNIAGVATAVVSGGPGAVFWMWVTAIFGMATKYAEAILAVKYRTVGKRGEMAGGPMYYIERGLGWKWLAVLFAVFGAIAAFGIGSTVQSNSVAASVQSSFGINPWITGIILTIITGLVIIGGIKSIGRVTSYLVPVMAVLYVLGGLLIILLNTEKLPAAVAMIFNDAFTGQAIAGGAIGTVIRYGVARGVFSNEAGMGSAPIAAAAAITDYPGRQALVSMTGTFIDTIVVCSITGIGLVMSGLYLGSDLTGAALTTQAFQTMLPGPGGWIVTIGLIFFAYSTVLGWSYYGEKCFEYLFGSNAIIGYRIAFTLSVLVGAGLNLGLVWSIADIFNGLMAVPNLIGLIGLSGIVVAETKRFREQLKLERQQRSTEVES